MGFFAKLDRHTDLMNRMADTVHADLTEALVHGRLSAMELRNAVLACSGCESPEACAHWLDDHKAGSDETPRYCRNDALFARLKD